MDYPKSVPGIGLVGGKFTDGNPLLSLPASLDPASWANAVTDELLNVIQAGGFVPTEGDHAQLVAAVTALARGVLPKRSFAANDYIRIPDVPGGLIIQWMQATASTVGSANSFPIAFPSNVRGLVSGAFANTGGVTLNFYVVTVSGFTFVKNTGVPDTHYVIAVGN